MATGDVDQADIVPSVMIELALDKLSVRTPVQCKKGSNKHDTRIHQKPEVTIR